MMLNLVSLSTLGARLWKLKQKWSHGFRVFWTGLLAVGGLSFLVSSQHTLPKAYAVTDAQPTAAIAMPAAIVTKSQVTKMQPVRDVSSDATQVYCKYILTLPRDKQGSFGELCRR